MVRADIFEKCPSMSSINLAKFVGFEEGKKQIPWKGCRFYQVSVHNYSNDDAKPLRTPWKMEMHQNSLQIPTQYVFATAAQTLIVTFFWRFSLRSQVPQRFLEALRWTC